MAKARSEGGGNMIAGRWFRIAVASPLLLLAGCMYIPLATEASQRSFHEAVRKQPYSTAFIQRQLDASTCMQLNEWEQAVLYETRRAEARSAFATLSLTVLRDDLARLLSTMAARGCPSRDVLLALGAPLPVTPTMLAFRCVCWQPYSYYPIADAGDGPAGPDCITVRAELSPGRFVFFERAPNWGERRHEITADTPVFGSLERETVRRLIEGASHDPKWTNNETDGWLEMRLGSFRMLADDCSALAPATASAIEKTVIRWIEAPAN
jgi:hypothetical protein